MQSLRGPESLDAVRNARRAGHLALARRHLSRIALDDLDARSSLDVGLEIARLCQSEGRLDRAAEIAVECLGVASTLADPRVRGRAAVSCAPLLERAGFATEAAHCLAEALAVLPPDETTNRAAAAYGLVVLACESGAVPGVDPGEAVRFVQAAIEAIPLSDQPPSARGALAWARASASVHSCEMEAAAGYYREASTLFLESGDVTAALESGLEGVLCAEIADPGSGLQWISALWPLVSRLPRVALRRRLVGLLKMAAEGGPAIALASEVVEQMRGRRRSDRLAL